MCGRYTLTTLDGFEPFFEINERPELEPRYNIAPSQDIPVIIPTSQGRRAGQMRWGLVPYWSDADRVGSGWINARSESIDRKPAFKESFARRRCLIPSDGFYEWIKSTPKRPVHYALKEGGLFAYAGIWDRWRDSEGETLFSCAILTTPANTLVSEVHDRMPAMLDRKQFSSWLAADIPLPEVKSLLRPFPAERMKGVEVSRYVNSPFNEGSECLEPVSSET